MNEAGKNSYADCDHRTGNVGSAIALGLKNKGHAVTLGARDPEATKVTALGLETGAGVALPAEATATADVVILALPWATADGAMNPLGMIGSTLGLTVGHDTSGGEIVQGWLPDALVVKTLNQVGAEIMANTCPAASPGNVHGWKRCRCQGGRRASTGRSGV